MRLAVLYDMRILFAVILSILGFSFHHAFVRLRIRRHHPSVMLIFYHSPRKIAPYYDFLSLYWDNFAQ